MAEQATILTSVAIDISPDGIRFTIDGLDTDLANLLQTASKFTVTEAKYKTVDTSTVTIISDKKIQFVDRD